MVMLQAIERLYTGRCNVIEKQKVKDEQTHITSLKDVVTLENRPCRVSYETIQHNGGEAYSTPTQIIKLFIAPGVEIKEGSVIEVTQNGITRRYKRSGTPAVYVYHQEIMLELEDKHS